MNLISSSITAPDEARQARRLLLSLDLTIVAFLLTLICVGFPLGMTIAGQFVDVSELPLNHFRTLIVSYVWLGAVIATLTTIAAILLLGAPPAVHCNREAVVYSVLSSLALVCLVLEQTTGVPRYIANLITFIQLFLIPLVLLLIYRKTALFVKELKVSQKCMASMKMLVASMLFLQLSRAWAPVAQLLTLDSMNSMLVGAAITAICACLLILVWLRLVSISFAVRRQLAQQLATYRQATGSDGLSVGSTADRQSGESAYRSETGWLVYGAIPLLLILELCVVGGLSWQQSSLQQKLAAERQQEQDALALTPEEREQLLREAAECNNEVWSVVIDPSGQVDPAKVQQLDKYASRIRQASFNNTLGVAYYRLGQYDKAQERLQMAIAMYSFTGAKHPVNSGFMALVQLRAGNKEQAEKYVQEFESLMEDPKFRNDAVCKSVQQEIQELFSR